MVPPQSGRTGTETRLAGLKGIVARHIRRWPKPPLVQDSHPALVSPAMSTVTQVLVRLIPWALGLAFLVSFLWDFGQLAMEYTGSSFRLLKGDSVVFTWSLGWLPLPSMDPLPLQRLVRVLSVSGLIGFFTNWLAITMLFRPRSRHPIVGQGVIPAQRDRIIAQLAKAIDGELIGPEIIKYGIRDSGVVPMFLAQTEEFLRGLLDDDDFRAEIRSVIRAYVEDALSSEDVREEIVDLAVSRLKESFDGGVGAVAAKAMLQLADGPLRSAVHRAIREMPQGLDIVLERLDRMLDALPDNLTVRSDAIEEWATKAVQNFFGNLDVRTILVRRLQSFDDRRLEKLIKDSSNDQINYIKYLGGVLGVVGGLVIISEWLLLVLATLVLVLISVDLTILRLLRHREHRRNTAAT